MDFNFSSNLMNYGYNPYMQRYTQNGFQNNQAQQLIRVNGIDGAKAYQLGANSQIALFDSNEDLMYIKVTDGAGFPTIRTFKFEELHNFGKNQDLNVENKQYVSREEMEEYVKHIIQSTGTTTDNATSESTTITDDKSNSKQKWNDSRTDGKTNVSAKGH